MHTRTLLGWILYLSRTLIECSAFFPSDSALGYILLPWDPYFICSGVGGLVFMPAFLYHFLLLLPQNILLPSLIGSGIQELPNVSLFEKTC